MERVRFTLPMPPKVLSPNARPHWAVKAKAAKAYRFSARMAATAAWPVYAPSLDEADVVCVFRFKDRRNRDRDNLLASMKAAFDGLADAGVVRNDSGFRHEVRFGEPTDDPHVEIIISERVSA
ncbi:MAG: endodeoxyribonuclease RusA [Pseudomonadota bacterium]|jgi:crossover junction endodeoxyribonuclease RusA